jgi:peptidoglycan/xylan/chitin deacetylase (PgdA/CDA1 family)
VEGVDRVIKQVSSFATRNALFTKLLSLLEQADSRRPNLLRVLTYHRVDEPERRPDLYPGLISATPEAFDQQMSYLAANYNIVSMPELLDACSRGRMLPPRSVMVTFDDACRDFAEHAWPTLKRYHLPATLFVPTAFPDQPERSFWWDQLYQALTFTQRRDDLDTPLGRLPLRTPAQRAQVFVQLKDYVKTLSHPAAMEWVERTCAALGAPRSAHNVLSWDELRRLAREGVALGAHTRTHPLMNRVSPDEARAEAVGSLHDLEREIGQAPPIFAYPSGGFNDQVVRTLAREGFKLAFTTVHGVNDMQDADRLRLRRINVGRRTNLSIFRARLLPWSLYLNRWRPLSGA